jgi:hypothetical protein
MKHSMLGMQLPKKNKENIDVSTEGPLSRVNTISSYLFKKILISDWLTANCEIFISTQWLTKYGSFTFILAK